MSHFFITGTAGFIGFNLARRLLSEGHSVLGYDNLNEYYDKNLKIARHDILNKFDKFGFMIANLENIDSLYTAANLIKPDYIIHLAAQAGVRYSIEKPRAYISSNLIGSFNLLEVAKEIQPKHLLLASSSSVYGDNNIVPFFESDNTDYPVSLYAATKKSMEVMASSYSQLYDIPTTCMRLFTVYGPWGRPDMALFKFVDAISNDKHIEIYGSSRTKRDYTFIGDVVEAITRLIDMPPLLWRIVNIAGGKPVSLLEFIEVIEKTLDKKAKVVRLPMKTGDVIETFADYQFLESLIGYHPQTPLDVGIDSFIGWYYFWKNSSVSKLGDTNPPVALH